MAVQELLVRLGLEDSSFTKQMKAINKEIKLLDSEFDALSSSTEEFEKTQEGLQKKLETTKKKLDLMVGALEKNENKQAEIRDELEKLRKTYEGFDKSVASTKDKLEVARAEMEKTSKESQELKDKIKHLTDIEEVFDKTSESIKKNNEKLEQANKKYTDLTKQINTHRDAIQKLNEKQEKQISSMMDSKEKLNSLQKTYNENKREIDSLNRAYEQAILKYGENSSEATKLKNTLSSLEKEQSELKVSIDSEIESYEKLKKTVEKTDNEIDSHSKKLNKLQTQVEKVKNEINKYENELKDNKKAQEEAHKELEKYNLACDDLEESIKTLKNALAKEKQEIQDLDNATGLHQQTIKELESQLIAEQQQLDKTRRAIERKTDELTNLKLESRNVEKNINNLTNQIGDLEFSLKNLSLTNLAESLNTTGNTLTSIGNGLTTIGSTLTVGVSAPLTALGSNVTSTFTEFEERVRKVNAVFGGAGEDMSSQFQKISDKSREFAKTTEWSAVQIGEAYEYLAMAGMNIEESTDAMIPLLNLASIGMVDLGRATDIVSDTMTPFKQHLEDVGKSAKYAGTDFNSAKYMVDIFAQTISKSNTNVEMMGETLKYAASGVASAGGSFEDMAVAIATMANSSIKGSTAGTALATGLNRLIAPVGEGKKAMEQYGISVQKTADGNLDLMATMEHLREVMGDMDAIEKGRVAKAVFGQVAQKGWLPIINAEADAWEELKESIYNAEGASDKMMDQMGQSSAYAFKIMKSNIDDLKIALGDALAPALKDIAEKIGEFAVKISEWVGEMKESNPELLSFITKVGLAAVVIPPVITVLGLFTKGIGGIFSTAGKTVGGIINLNKAFGKLKNGTLTSTDKFSGLVTMLSKVGGFLGSTAGLLTTLGAAFVGLTAYIGSNEKALAWLCDEWGTFGYVVSRTCETIYGICQLVFGNIANLLIGIGKIVIAFFSGEWGDIDDIWAETMAKCESTTAKAMSNIKGESSKALKEIQNSTKEDLNELNNIFEVSLEKLPTVTKDNMKQVSKELTKEFKNLTDTQIEILRGTSDTMAVLFEGIEEGMDTSDMQKELEDNLKNLLNTGDNAIEELQKDFDEAQKLINDNIKDGYAKTKKEAENIMHEIGKITVNGIDDVTYEVFEMIRKMDNETFVTIKGMGGKWEEVFKGIENTTDLTSQEMLKIIKENLNSVGVSSAEEIQKLIDALEAQLKESKTSIENNVKDTTEGVKKQVESANEGVNKVLEALTSNTDVTMTEFAQKIVDGVATMGYETAKELEYSSDEWYAILNGAYDENGQLNENFIHSLIGNFNYLNLKTPEQVAEYMKNITVGFETTTEKATEESEKTKKTVVDNLGKIVEESEDVGMQVTENVTPENLEEKVKEAMKQAEEGLNQQKQSFSDEAKEIAQEAEEKFRKELENMATVEIPDTILNVEKIQEEMGLAGQVAVEAFATSWSDNSYLIHDGINVTFTAVSQGVTKPFAGIELAMQSLGIKIGVVGDATVEAKDRLNEIQGMDFKTPKDGADSLKKSLEKVKTNAENAKSAVLELRNISLAELNSSFSNAKTKLESISTASKDAKGKLDEIANVSFKKATDSAESLKNKLDSTKKSANNLKDVFDKLSSFNFENVKNNLENVKNKIVNIKDNASTAKTKLEEMNNVSFTNLINRLSSVNSWLSSIQGSASSARSRIQEVNSSRSAYTGGYDGYSGYSLMSIASDFAETSSQMRTPIDMSNYQTRGSYYTPTSLAGTGRQVREIESQKQQLELMQKQNELLLQILAADRNINISVDVDGKAVAKSTAKYMEKEISMINNRKNRLRGI